MNTTEHIVEQYYRLKGYFTNVDVKVIGGNNRQFDLIAIKPNNTEIQTLHVEISVAHGDNWLQTLETIGEQISKKFFGTPRPDNKPTSDYQKGKNYYESIKNTYRQYNLDHNKITRVWCTWALDDLNEESKLQWQEQLAIKYDLKPENFQILLFRDEVLPFMLEIIGTSNYDDEILRIFSLLKQYEKQKK